MKLKAISIKNYKSIENLEIEINEIDESFTYAFLGINESGKSSILKAISFYTESEINYPSDFHNTSIPIEIIYKYEINDDELQELRNFLIKSHSFDRALANIVRINEVRIYTQHTNSDEVKALNFELIYFEKSKFENFTYDEIAGKIVKKTSADDPHLDLSNYFHNYLTKYFRKKSHNVVFWQSTPEFLLLDDIDLQLFASNPSDISIPLTNCFLLAGIPLNNIEKEIEKLKNSVAVNSLQSKLSDYTTQHINELWPGHPITITFQITDSKISLLIEDNGIKYSPKTASQRSDGFKQFLSFLLTVSVQNKGSQLEKTILLIDEPETHLHPPAQLNLLKELIQISTNKKNNIVFFATHSNYLIDKNFLDRNYKVVKLNNQNTVINRIERKSTSYAEVNYDIFQIVTNDYHNELYGYIEAEDKSKLDTIQKERKWFNSKANKEFNVSLPEYIRHSIHHPENTTNKKFTDKDLKKSIDILIKIKEEIISDI